MSERWGVRVERQTGRLNANLQEIALYTFKNLRLDATRCNACQTQKPHDCLHFCSLRNHILDRGNLIRHIVRRKEI